MELKVGKLPEAVRENALDPVHEEPWQPAEGELTEKPLLLPRSWGRSTSRPEFVKTAPDSAPASLSAVEAGAVSILRSRNSPLPGA